MKKKDDPLPIVGAHPEDDPLVCIQLNRLWIPYIIGLLWPAKFPEYWGGTLDENRDTRRDVQTLITILESSLECSDMSNPCCDGTDLLITVQTRVDIYGKIEISIDGGATWHDSPDNPGTLAPQLPPYTVLNPAANKCDAASNILEHMKDTQLRWSGYLRTIVTLGEFLLEACEVALEALLLILKTPEQIQAAGLAILAFLRALYGTQADVYDALFDNALWDKVTCILYCNISEDGTFTAEGWQKAYDGMQTIPDTSGGFEAAGSLQAMLRVWGYPGINTVAANGVSSTADCSDCDCGCNLADWRVQTLFGGIEISRDTTSITVQGVVSEVGQWQAAVRTDDVHKCCFLQAIITDGVGNAIYCHNRCGETIDEAAYKHCGLIPTGTVLLNSVLFASNAPFTATFFFASP